MPTGVAQFNPAAIPTIIATVGSWLFAAVWWRISHAPGWRDARWLALVCFTAGLYCAGDLVCTIPTSLLMLRVGLQAVGSIQSAFERMRSSGPFDAVLCDLIMPDGGGPRLAEMLGDEDPELLKRTIFITGGAVGDDARAWIGSSPNRVLYKPICSPTLRQAILEAASVRH